MKMALRFFPAAILFFTVIWGFALLRFPAHSMVLAACSIGFLVSAVAFLSWKRKSPNVERFVFIGSYFAFCGSGVIFFLFLEQRIFQYADIALLAIVGYLFSEQVYRFLYSTGTYQISALTNLVRYMGILSIFFGTVSIFDMRFFFGVRTEYLVPSGIVFFFLISYGIYWTARASLKKSAGYALLTSFLYGQIVIALFYLPHIPLVKGVVTLALAYAIIQILVLSIVDEISRTKVLRTLIISGIVLVIALTTAQWF